MVAAPYNYARILSKFNLYWTRAPRQPRRVTVNPGAIFQSVAGTITKLKEIESILNIVYDYLVFCLINRSAPSVGAVQCDNMS